MKMFILNITSNGGWRVWHFHVKCHSRRCLEDEKNIGSHCFYEKMCVKMDMNGVQFLLGKKLGPSPVICTAVDFEEKKDASLICSRGSRYYYTLLKL